MQLPFTKRLCINFPESCYRITTCHKPNPSGTIALLLLFSIKEYLRNKIGIEKLKQLKRNVLMYYCLMQDTH